MTDFETHPVGTAARIDELKAALIEADARIPRFPDHMARIVDAKNEGLPERISALVEAIQSIPDYMRQYQWQADDKQSFGSKWVRTIAGDNGKGMGRQAIAEVVSHIGVADYIAAANPDTVSLLIASLVKANAALAAAYEVAAKAAMGHCYAIMSATDADARAALIAVSIRALATPDHTTALDRLIAEAEARGMERAAGIAKQHNDHRDNEYAQGWDDCAKSIHTAILAASKKGGA